MGTGTGKVRDHGTEATRKTIEHWDGQDAHVYRQRVVIAQDADEPVSIDGEITPIAIDTLMQVSGKIVNTTAVKFVTTPLEERRLIMIENTHATSTLLIGTNATITSTFTDGATNLAWRVGPGETFNTLSGPNVDWYGMASTGTIDVYFSEGK